MRTTTFFTAVLISIVIFHPAASAQDDAARRWIDRFSYKPPLVSMDGVCAGTVGSLPTIQATPSATGTQMVRVSLPFAPAALPKGIGISVSDGVTTIEADLRVLTYHPGQPRSARRGIVTFPYEFASLDAKTFNLSPRVIPNPELAMYSLDESGATFSVFGRNTVTITPTRVTVSLPDRPLWTANLIAPAPVGTEQPLPEMIESGKHFIWIRVLCPDPEWPRIIEIRADALGNVVVRGHLQRLAKGDGTTPDLGWRVESDAIAELPKHSFADGYLVSGSLGNIPVAFPDAHKLRRGHALSDARDGKVGITYLRCSTDENVPMQESAWRTATIAVGPNAASFSPMLEFGCRVSINDTAPETSLALWPELSTLRDYHRNAIARAAIVGDDYGNVTSFSPGSPAGYYGMNRLNHCPSIFAEYERSGDAQLRETAVQWCANMHDLSLWWGDTPEVGGTRYNAAIAAGHKEHEGDTNFMWRTNGASNFCTKGYDSFLFAYEETGDPRFLTALNAQVAYAKQYVHTDQGECRNIGDVADFMRLYRATGAQEYLDEALRLFRELRTKLGDDSLFSQGGQPIAKDGPYIDDDQHGYDAPFAKPYIIGYALAGLPDLLDACPDEPRLRDVVRAVADFLAESGDPSGGWRYPHPRSSGTIISQGMEHAAQMMRAADVLERRGEDVSNLIDAIETVLQARVMCFQRTGQILSGLSGWESAAGTFKDGKTIYDLYAKPGDRDATRDYTEGAVGVGGAPPDGLVYFDEVLTFYLRHRPAERLFHTNDKLAQVLARVPDARLKLTPQEAGSFLRVEHPSNPQIGYTIWGPEWISVPLMGYAQEELGGMKLDWKRDEVTGAVAYTIDRPDATFTAEFIPHVGYVECLYTTWPKPDATITGGLAVGPCQQLKEGVFNGDDADILSRMQFLVNGTWTSLASCANGNARNIQFIKGQQSSDVTGAMAESGWKTIHEPKPDVPLLACVSTDGQWIAATAAENGTTVCNNANESHRCMHSHGSVPLRRDGPSTLRVMAYLMQGSLDDLRVRYERDLARWREAPAAPGALYPIAANYGVRDTLPSFNDVRVSRMQFDATRTNSTEPFAQWREHARQTYLEALGTRPPLAPLGVTDIAQEDRGSYVAHKTLLNISADERVTGYLLVPKGEGPYPCVIALHDHGAHFSIGKEKVVRPFGVSEERAADAHDWITKYYGGRYIGDAMAERGYVVFATDALFWGDRGRFGGVKYEDQQALGANMMHLGLSWAGKIVWDDVRSAEFVQGLPYVDPERIACMGLSMGSHRTWSLCAATDIVKCGTAICWMGDTATLTKPGNNQTTGQSAFSMLVPNLRNALDYPDVASIACPKPMLFFNGTEDGLFPVPGVEASYAKMRAVWDSHQAGDKLVTKLWPVPHEFNAAMQDEAFSWLEAQLAVK